MTDSLLISVVVPTYRRPDLLERCLAALVAQDLDPSHYEIVVADDANSAATRAQVARWAEGPHPPPSPMGRGSHIAEPHPLPVSAVQVDRALESAQAAGEAGLAPTRAATPWEAVSNVIPAHPSATHLAVRPLPSQGRGWEVRFPSIRYVVVTGAHGPAAARNAGWRAACGVVIAFTDDDCVPDPGWLRAGLAAMGEGVAGVSGRLALPLPAEPTDYERDAARLAEAEFVTANCFYRREALEEVGGFDERFTAAWREDSDLFFALRSRGARLVFAPAALVVHPVRPAPWGVSLRQQRKSQFNALLYKKHPVLYRERIQAAPPWRYYALVGTLLAALLALCVGRPRASLLALGGWALLTGQFCAERLRGTSRAPRHVAEMAVTSALIPPLSVFWRLYGAVKYRVWFL